MFKKMGDKVNSPIYFRQIVLFLPRQNNYTIIGSKGRYNYIEYN